MNVIDYLRNIKHRQRIGEISGLGLYTVVLLKKPDFEYVNQYMALSGFLLEYRFAGLDYRLSK